jgi:hypothetical protein
MNKFNSIKGISTIIVIIITALVVGASVYLWQNFDLVSKNDSKEVINEELVKEADEKLCERDGFSFLHPKEYICDSKGLWTEEGYEWHINPPETCDTCQIPYIEVRVETTDKTLEKFIIDYLQLPGENFKDMSQLTGIPYEEVKLGSNDFIKITVPDMFAVTGYYTKHNNTVVAFRVYWDEYDDEELQKITSTLKFN